MDFAQLNCLLISASLFLSIPPLYMRSIRPDNLSHAISGATFHNGRPASSQDPRTSSPSAATSYNEPYSLSLTTIPSTSHIISFIFDLSSAWCARRTKSPTLQSTHLELKPRLIHTPRSHLPLSNCLQPFKYVQVYAKATQQVPKQARPPSQKFPSRERITT